MARFKHPAIERMEEDITKQMAHEMSDVEMFDFEEFDDSLVEKTGYSNYSYWRSTFQAFARKKSAMFFLSLVVLLVLFTFIQPLLPGQIDYFVVNNDPASGLPYRNLPPGTSVELMNGTQHTFILGTNSIGQDLWSNIWAGTRTSLFIGVTVAVIEAVVGIIVGILWGYVRKLDFFFTELYNVLDNIPVTIVLILVAYILPAGVGTLILAMSLTGWIGMARFIRNFIIIIRDREYNLASRCLGTKTPKIILKNLLPFLISIIMLRMALAIPANIGYEVFITYIGLGLPATVASLGNLINVARTMMLSPALRYQLIYPTIILSLVTISFYVSGNAFSDAADPRQHV